MFFQAKASLEAIGGYDVETASRPIDPLHLAKYIPAEKLRKYETVHCRVAMLACVGYAFPRELLLYLLVVTVNLISRFRPIKAQLLCRLCFVVEDMHVKIYQDMHILALRTGPLLLFYLSICLVVR